MVRLVLVSHSRALADDLVAFVRQMAGDEVSIDVAAGTGEEDDDGFGTDVSAILNAITSAPTDDGVVVLVDVGSAVMSAEMALEMLDEDQRANVRLSPAPFVEGTLAAAVQASLGAPLHEVLRESATALSQKQSAVDDVDGPGGPDGCAPVPEDPVPEDDDPQDASPHTDSEGPDASAHQVRAVLPNPHGLHARPAAQFVRAAAGFDAHVTVENRTTGQGPVSAVSLSEVIRLGASQGHELQLSASGPDATDALARLKTLVQDGFGETDDDVSPPSASRSPDSASEVETAPEDRSGETDLDVAPALQGVPVAPGFAVGPAVAYRPSLPTLPEEPQGDPASEWARLEDALDAVRTDLDADRDAVATSAPDLAGILDAQRLLLDDAALLDRVRQAVTEDGQSAERGWMAAIEAVADDYAALDDAYLVARAEDLRDLGHRVVRRLLDDPSPHIDAPDTPFVLVTDALVPSDVHALPDRTSGVLCAAGNPTSHSAILLRTAGIPSVFGTGPDVLQVGDGTRVGLDGGTGRVWTRVTDALARQLDARRRAATAQADQQRRKAQSPAMTTDGERVVVEANVNQPADAAAATRNGADGVGLLRTEFLFVDQDDAPSEDAQVDHLTTVAEALDGRPVTVRVLDAGGDKPLRYLSLPAESNPFLGLRGIRVLLRYPALFRRQLRAVLRVAARQSLRLLLPMIATAAEVRQTRDLLAEAREQLDADGIDAADSLPIGAMIETPASAVSIPQLAPEIDFLSIGTNDLTQYTMAADREHADLAGLSDALAPPVLTLLKRVVEDGAAHDLPVSLCGELGADREAVPVLVGLGLRRLSVTPPAIPTVKALVRALDTTTAAQLADDALVADDAAAVRRLSRSVLSEVEAEDA